jgi:hypothetical protein
MINLPLLDLIIENIRGEKRPQQFQYFLNIFFYVLLSFIKIINKNYTEHFESNLNPQGSIV